jgi:hypothetical protein
MTLFELPQVVLVGGTNMLVLVPHPLGGVVRRVGMVGVVGGKSA